MKFLMKILIIVLVILISLFITIYIFVNIKGKELLVQKLEDALKEDVSIGYVGLKIPLSLEVRKLKIGELADVDYIYASPSLFGLLVGKIIINEVRVLKPEISWERGAAANEVTKNEPINNIEKDLNRAKEITNSPRTNQQQLPAIIIRHLRVKEGLINFTDRVISDSGIQMTLREVLLDIDNLSLFPKSTVTNFQLNAKIPWQEDSGEGTVYASGWVDLYKKDVEARLEIDDIDGVYLHPYYSKWVDLENSRIKEASLNLISDIKGQNNELVAKCRLELTDIKFSPRPPDQPEHKAEKIATAVLGIFRAINQGRIVLNFTIRTKIDKPSFNFDSINEAVDNTISKAIQSDKVKIEDAALLPGRFFEGVTKGTTGATKAIINGALSVGKSLKDAFIDSLKTEQESEEGGSQQGNPLQE